MLDNEGRKRMTRAEMIKGGEVKNERIDLS